MTFKLFAGDRVVATEDMEMDINSVLLEGTIGEIVEKSGGSTRWYWVVWKLPNGERIEGYHYPHELGYLLDVID